MGSLDLSKQMGNKYTFSGHETFPCRNLWLKKGYDFVANGGDFNAPDAVVTLGVGKNMVSSIRFWLKAFGMTMEDKPTEMARKLFDDGGWDPYCEDELTLWLLHYQLVTTDEASLYKIVFQGHQRRNREFDKAQLQHYVEVTCKNDGYDVNKGTLSKDINILFQNYIYPDNLTNPERYSNLLIGLRLLRYLRKDERINDKTVEIYGFTDVKPDNIPEEVILYALLDHQKQESILSNDILTDIALTFCMSMNNFTKVVSLLAVQYPDIIAYTDNSGIRNVHFVGKADTASVLENYYKR